MADGTRAEKLALVCAATTSGHDATTSDHDATTNSGSKQSFGSLSLGANCVRRSSRFIV